MSTRTTRSSAITGGSPNLSNKKSLANISNNPSGKTAAKEPIAKARLVKQAALSDVLLNSILKTAVSKDHKDGGSKVKSKDNTSSANVGKKRKRITLSESVPGYGDEEHEKLPHNMGGKENSKKMSVKDDHKQRAVPSAKKRAMAKAAMKEEENESQPDNKVPDTATEANSPASIKTMPGKKSANAAAASPTLEKKIKSSSKKNTYGVSEGVSPFPNYPRPTPEECYKVAELLRKAHPNCRPRPKTIPEPSQIVAGCGEVPSILDAMIRTLLSAATNGRNSSNAYQGMVKRYGNREMGVGKGSVDYNAVRLAPQADLEKAIASGGLAKNKSKNIKAILDLVYEENQQRRKDLLMAKAAGSCDAKSIGAMEESEEQRHAEITLAEENVLSLDHLYYLPTYAAISHFTKYPGIGVKTAACVSLFCMQRDCFAVDTHVFRLCKWLGWVPDQSAPDYVQAKGEPRVDRDPTFSHLEVRIPDELKYDLHQLFIQHGKKCGRCRGNTTENHPEWAKGCPIEELVNRKGPRKGGSPMKKAGKAGKKSAKKIKQATDEDDVLDDDEDFEMSDLVEDEEDEDVEEAMPDLDDEEEYKIPLKSKGNTPASSTKKGTRVTRATLATPSKVVTSARKLTRKKS